MREVGAFEAKNKLGQLLDLVERGEEVTITRHGRKVARLIPVHPAHGRDQARAALRRIRERAEAQDSANSIGRNGKPTGTKGARESRSRQLGDARLDVCRRNHRLHPQGFRCGGRGAFVPSLWRLEIANSLTGAMPRGRIDPEFRRAALADLAFLDISVDDRTDSDAWVATLDFADRFRLTVYDAAYVELAGRRGIPLATLDMDMRSAGAALGLRLLGAS